MMEQSREKQQEPTTLPISQPLTNNRDCPVTFLNERNEARTRSLQDIYETIKRLDNITLFVYLLIVKDT